MDVSQQRRALAEERAQLERDRRDLRREKWRDHKPKEKKSKKGHRRRRSDSDSDDGHRSKKSRAAPLPAAAAYAPAASYDAYAPPPLFRDTAAQAASSSFQHQLQRFAQPPPAAPQQRFSGHEQANYLRCLCCGADCSSEVAFCQHIASKKHAKKNRGRVGFAGLAPNAAGGIPPLRHPQLRQAARAFGWDPDRQIAPNAAAAAANPVVPGGHGGRPAGPWAPPPAFVSVAPDLLARARASLGAVVDDVGHYDGRLADAARRSRFERGPPPPPAAARADPHGAIRRGLPVFEYRPALLEAMARLTPAAPCLVVEGETGSGKSTQVPQYIIEDAHARNVSVDVLVTQPRRIAAIGVAERIAAERGELCGEAVGYAIKGEARCGPATCLTLSTTGVALRRLQEDGLKGVTHVIVDEVHERSLETDFLLLALAQLAKLRRDAGEAPVKIVLMSATMPGAAVQKYFGASCPAIRFPGRAFPVEALYLEEALAVTRHVVRPAADWHRSSSKSERIQKRLADVERNGGLQTLRLLPSDPAECARRFGAGGVARAIADADENILNVDLVCDLVEWFALHCAGDVDVAVASAKGRPPPSSRTTTTPLATLVFCAGVQDIDDVLATLRRTGRFDPNWLRPLHGSLPPDDQRRVFEVPPPGVAKVVVATNVAETSITIPDVGFVVDGARVKEERYDPQRHMASLDDVYVSRSSAKQRRGRAGRVRDGLAVHLVPRVAVERAGDASAGVPVLETHAQPEVRRVALDQLVLRLKALPEGVVPGRTAADACAALPEPPEPEAVRRAAVGLVAIGALERREEEEDERLTDLGAVLARLPIDAKMGKLCVLGCCFDGCLDAALTIAAALGNRSPFLSPLERREEADRSKKEFCAVAAGPSHCGRSDLLCVRNAYDAFEAQGQAKYEFARRRFLGIKTLQQIAKLKRQLLQALAQAGLAPGVPRTIGERDLERDGRMYGDTDGCRAALARFRRTAAPPPPSDAALAALVAAALFPQVAHVHAPNSKKSGAACNPENIKLQIRDPDGRETAPQEATCHPSSVRGRLTGDGWVSPYACFHEKVRTTKVYVRDATPVPPLGPYLLTGNRLDVEDDDTLVLDGWLRCVAPGGAAAVVAEFRDKVEARVGDLLGGRAPEPADAAALLSCLEALVAQEASALPVSYKQRFGQQASGGGGGGGGRSGKKRSGGGRKKRGPTWRRYGMFR